MKRMMTLLFCLALVGCAVNGPVKTSVVVDDRPRVSFEIKQYDPEQLELFVDHISYGSAARYLAENDNGAEAALRILPGNHRIELRMGRTVVFEKTDYFAEGMLSIFKVSPQ